MFTGCASQVILFGMLSETETEDKSVPQKPVPSCQQVAVPFPVGTENAEEAREVIAFFCSGCGPLTILANT